VEDVMEGYLREESDAREFMQRFPRKRENGGERLIEPLETALLR